jgi:hypothetical protein
MDGGFVKTRPLRPLEAVRSFGVMLGGSIAPAAVAAASSVAVARAFMSVRRPSPLALFGTAGTGAICPCDQAVALALGRRTGGRQAPAAGR